MKELISKIQYNDFELGEFIEIKKRNYADTISVIENFPWNEQRKGLVVDLTNQSITIEGENADFLKLAVFFNGKFVLHYLDNKKQLYTKSFINIQDSYQYIDSFFSLNFDANIFKKENTWLKNNLKHFVSQNFNYSVTAKSAFRFLLRTSIINFLFLICMVILLVTSWSTINDLGKSAFLILMFLIGGGFNLLFFFNYYFKARDKILIMSKGRDTFYYGSKASPDKYDKKNILQITRIQLKNTKSSLASFAIIKIEFINGGIIKIPNLLIDEDDLQSKLYAYKKILKNTYPIL